MTVSNATISRIEIQGVTYDVKVSYHYDDGTQAPFDPNNTPSLLDKGTGKLKQELNALITSAVVTHAKNRPLSDLKVMQLNRHGAQFNEEPLQPHDFDLSNEQQQSLLAYGSYQKTNQVWDRASKILIENYHHYQQAASEASISVPVTQVSPPYTTIDLTVTPPPGYTSPSPSGSPSGTPPPAFTEEFPDVPPYSRREVDKDGKSVIINYCDRGVGDNFLTLQELSDAETAIESDKVPLSLIELHNKFINTHLTEKAKRFRSSELTITPPDEAAIKAYTDDVYNGINLEKYENVLETINEQYAYIEFRLDPIATKYPAQKGAINQLKLSIVESFNFKLIETFNSLEAAAQKNSLPLLQDKNPLSNKILDIKCGRFAEAHLPISKSRMTVAPLDNHITELANITYENMKTLGFKSILNAMQYQYNAIIREIEAIAIRFKKQAAELDQLKQDIGNKFSESLLELLKTYYTKHRDKREGLVGSWTLFTNTVTTHAAYADLTAEQKLHKIPGTKTYTKETFNSFKSTLN